MISFNDLSFSYANHILFENLNFHVDKGSMVFIIGKSGSGKSTLMKLIYMNRLPQKGSVMIAGYDSAAIKKRDIPFLRRKIGVIFQDFKLLDDRNIFENLAFILESTGTSGKAVRKRVLDVLSEVGLSHKMRSMPTELSGGEQQRIAIARAVINNPDIVLADEPTGNLDPETSMEILDILKKVNAKGTTVLISTHNYELVKRTESKIYKLENGKIFKVVMRPKK